MQLLDRILICFLLLIFTGCTNKKYELNIGALEERVVMLEAKLKTTEEKLSRLSPTDGATNPETETAATSTPQDNPPEEPMPEPMPEGTQEKQTDAKTEEPGTLEPTFPASEVPDYYEKGRAAYEAGEWGEAERLLSAITTQYLTHDLAPNAAYWYAEVAYSKKEFQEALSRFNAVVTQFPKSRKTPDALFKSAKCHEKLGHDEEAVSTYRKVVALFPESAAAGMAKEWL